MSRQSNVAKEIRTLNVLLFKHINSTWIFTSILLPELKKRANSYLARGDNKKLTFKVPKLEKMNVISRQPAELAKLLETQIQRGVFETNILSLVSRMEGYILDCILIVLLAHPERLRLLAGNEGIPLNIFLENESREDVIRRYVELRCEGLMFSSPGDYLKTTQKIMSITLDQELVDKYIEIKATRDILVHNNGIINRIYQGKSRKQSRGKTGDLVSIDQAYFKHVVVTLKLLSRSIQSKTELAFK